MADHTRLSQCSKQVSHAGDWTPSRCENKATVVVNDRAYCTIHSPDYVAKKQAEQNQRYEARRAAYKATEQAAAEMRRRADCYPELLAALEELLEWEISMAGLGHPRLGKARAAIAKAQKQEQEAAP